MFKQEEKIFQELNTRLAQEDMQVSIICVGGFVLSHYGMRATHDIDAFFQETDRLRAIIEEVGDKFGINKADELWLNNAVKNLNAQPPEYICDVLYQFSNLRVLVPPLDYIAGMKLCSGREQDIQDVADIIKREGLQSPAKFLEKMSSYGFLMIDESVLLEAFGRAYGMNWLGKYYLEHEEEIIGRI